MAARAWNWNEPTSNLRVYPEVVGGYGSGDEPGLGRLESDGADLDPPDDLVFQSLVVNLNVVVGGEVPLGIVVDVHMHPAADGATGAQVHLVIEPRRLEAATAAGIRIEQQGGTAALVAKAVGSELEPDLAVECKVGILRRQPQHAASPTGRLSGVSRHDRSGLAV